MPATSDVHPLPALDGPVAARRAPPAHGGPRQIHPDLIVCPYCDAVLNRPDLGARQSARCPQCAGVVMRSHAMTLDGQLALVLTALIVFVLANGFPVVELEVAGRRHGSTLAGAAWQLWRDGSPVVAVCALAVGSVFPLLEILLRLVAVLAVRRPQMRDRQRRRALNAVRLLQHVQHWSMTEVYLIGMLVTIFKIGAMASVIVDVGVVAMAALTVLMGALRTTGLRAVVEATDRGWADGAKPAEGARPPDGATP